MTRDALRGVLMAALALFVLGVSPQPREVLALGPATLNHAGWTRVSDNMHALSLSVPPGWKTVVAPRGGSVVAIAPGGMPQVSAVLERVAPSMTTQEYAANKLQALRATLPSARALPIQFTIQIFGVQAHVAALAWSTNGNAYAITQVAAASNGAGAVLTETFDPASQGGEALAEAVGRTFEVTGTPPVEQAAIAGKAVGRRDLFAAPPGVAPTSSRGPGGGSASTPLPPLPVPEAPGPVVAPAPLPGLPGTANGESAVAPPVALRGIVLGATPQAVLVSGTSYKIVAIGQETPWGTVRAITATTVILRTVSGSRTLTLEAKPAVTDNTPPGSK